MIKIFCILASLLMFIGQSNTLLFKDTVANGCGYSTLTSKCQKHTTCGGNFFGMKQIIVNSKTYGEKIILVDDCDFELVSKYTWNVDRCYSGDRTKFYAIHSKNLGRDETGKFRYTSFKMHRLIMGFPKCQIDHHDNDGLNNQRYNLRLATHNQNGYNQQVNINSKSGFKGVSYKETEGRYAVRIRVNGKIVYGGGYQNIIMAARKYNELALIHHGEFAKLNVITPEMEKQYEGVPNRPPRKNQRDTGYVGVIKEAQGFVATIAINRKAKRLGVFNTADEAAACYNEAAKKEFGDFAYQNIINT